MSNRIIINKDDDNFFFNNQKTPNSRLFSLGFYFIWNACIISDTFLMFIMLWIFLLIIWSLQQQYQYSIIENRIAKMSKESLSFDVIISDKLLHYLTLCFEIMYLELGLFCSTQESSLHADCLPVVLHAFSRLFFTFRKFAFFHVLWIFWLLSHGANILRIPFIPNIYLPEKFKLAALSLNSNEKINNMDFNSLPQKNGKVLSTVNINVHTLEIYLYFSLLFYIFCYSTKNPVTLQAVLWLQNSLWKI